MPYGIDSPRTDFATAEDLPSLLGNFSMARDYSFYLQNSASINALIAAEPDSAFTAGWVITLARAVELGLLKRHEADFYGGFEQFLKSEDAVASNVSFTTFNGERIVVLTDRSGNQRIIRDTIDSGAKDVIDGTAGNDTITVNGATIADSTGLTINGEAADGTAHTIDIAAEIHGGDGDDTIIGGDMGNELYGDGGNDTLTGGKTADWLYGGAGNDILQAEGDGDYLDGGTGDDVLNGDQGSQWFEGGAGADVIQAGAGGDVLSGGADADELHGGEGNDTYIFRQGDGTDLFTDKGYDIQYVVAGPGNDLVPTVTAGALKGAANCDWPGPLRVAA